jgi:hypothetical protein
LKHSGSIVYHIGDFFLGQHGEAVYDFAAKGSAWRFEFLFRPVDSADAFAVVAAVGVFAVVDYYARVEEGAADVPEDVGETTGLWDFCVSWSS